MSDKGRILMVARESEWRTFVERVLEQAGYTVHVCEDSQSAFQDIINDGFHLIIVDALLVNLLK